MDLPELRQLFTREEVTAAVKKLAGAISRDYRGKNPVFIGILKGSFVFLADLIRQLDFPLEVEFVRCSSYGHGIESAGKVKVVHGLRTDIRGRHVMVVEDIIDTGVTTSFFMDFFKKKKPASIRLCALTDKPSRRRLPVKIDYLGLTVPNKFIVGYGIDCDEKYRNLPYIGYLEDAQACRTADIA
jgi:hypoxanthine phosphoribosyltransferase